MRSLSSLGEVACYAGLFLLALALRLGGLEGRPLSPNEAEVGYAAWRLVRGGGLASAPSPLALDITTVTFFLAGASDLTARLGSVLAGSLMVPASALFRRQLGSWGALATAALLAASPALIHSSQELSSASLALLLSVVGASLLLRWGEEERWAFWGLCALAGLLLNGGVTGIGFLLVGLLFVALRVGLGHGFPLPIWRPVLGGVMGAGVFLASFYLTASTLTINWAGVSLASLSEWADAFSNGGLSGLGALPVWASYEPLVLFLGGWGLVRWLRERSKPDNRLDLARMNGLLLLWTGMALILLMVGQVAAFAPFLVLPLALWGGPILVVELERLRHISWEWRAAFYLVGLAGVVLTLLVANWLTLNGSALPAYYWLLILLGLAPTFLIVALVIRGRMSSWPLRALGLAVLVALSVHSVSALSFGEPAAEPLVARTTPLDVRDDFDEVVTEAGNPYLRNSVEIQVDQSVAQPWMWYLRDYPRLVMTDQVRGNPAVAITAPGKGSSLVGYRKSRGKLWAPGQGPDDGGAAWWRWFVFRQPVEAPLGGEFEIFFRE